MNWGRQHTEVAAVIAGPLIRAHSQKIREAYGVSRIASAHGLPQFQLQCIDFASTFTPQQINECHNLAMFVNLGQYFCVEPCERPRSYSHDVALLEWPLLATALCLNQFNGLNFLWINLPGEQLTYSPRTTNRTAKIGSESRQEIIAEQKFVPLDPSAPPQFMPHHLRSVSQTVQGIECSESQIELITFCGKCSPNFAHPLIFLVFSLSAVGLSTVMEHFCVSELGQIMGCFWPDLVGIWQICASFEHILGRCPSSWSSVTKVTCGRLLLLGFMLRWGRAYHIFRDLSRARLRRSLIASGLVRCGCCLAIQASSFAERVG